jgi:hypothetical protein
MLIYVAVLVWLVTPEEDAKRGRLHLLQRAIHWHRARAEYHGRKVISYEAEYAELTA